MKKLILLPALLLSAQPVLAAGFTLGTNTVVQNLGVLLASANYEHPQLFTNIDGNRHLAIMYYGNTVNCLLDMNVDQHTAVVTNAWTGRIAPHGWAYRDGLVYWCNNNDYYTGTKFPNGNSIWESTLQSYNVTTGQTNFIAHPFTAYQGYCMAWSDDGWLYMGGYGAGANWPSGAVDRYNPGTKVFTNVGYIDIPDGSDYCYAIGADSRYCYALDGYNWHLSVWDSQSGSTNFVQYLNSGVDQNGTYIYPGASGGWWYVEELATGQLNYYALSNGVANYVTNNQHGNGNFGTNMLMTDMRGGMISEAENYSNYTGLTFDFAKPNPDSSNNTVVIGVQTNGSGVWNYITASNFNLTPASLIRAYPDGTNLFLLAYAYGPWLGYNPSSKVVTYYGTPPTDSAYDAVKVGKYWYVMGYDSLTYQFDPSAPWTLAASTPNKYDPSVNPHLLSLVLRQHEYYSCLGSDGLLYVAAWIERNGIGGQLGWLNLTNNRNGSVAIPDNNFAPGDLKPICGGSNLVYSCFNCGNAGIGSSNLLVFDVGTKSWLSTNAPLGTDYPGKVVEVAPGIILGLSSCHNVIYKWNCLTHTLIASNALGAAVFDGGNSINNRLSVAPDGYVWTFIGTTLERINPSDLSMTSILTNNPPLDIAWNGGDAYLYGGQNLYRVRRLLVSSPLQPASGVRLLGPH